MLRCLLTLLLTAPLCLTALAADEKPAAPATAASTPTPNRSAAVAAFVQALRDGFKELGLEGEDLTRVNKIIDEHIADVTRYNLAHQAEYAELGRQLNEAKAKGDFAGVKAATDKIKAIAEDAPSPDILFRALGDELSDEQQQKYRSIMERKKNEIETKYGKLPDPPSRKRRPQSDPLADAIRPVPASERIDPKKAIADLKLSPEQLQKLGAIMRETKEQADWFNLHHGDDMKRAVAHMKEAIAAKDPAAIEQANTEIDQVKTFAPPDVWTQLLEILTPDQRKQFEPVAEKLREQTRRDIASKLFGTDAGENSAKAGGK
jgi:hypothetical protein